MSNFMSNSVRGSTTEPNSPDSRHILENEADDSCKGDFARLIPKSRSARLAFHNLASSIRESDSALHYHRNFIHIQTELVDLDPETDYESTADESVVEVPDPDQSDILDRQPIYHGFWRLNLDIPPAVLALGWILGKGRWGQHRLDNDYGSVDILLTNDAHEGALRGRHARILHNLESNSLLIIADKKIRIAGEIVDKSDVVALVKSKTSIDIGSFSYSLEFTDLDPVLYRAQLNQLATQRGYTGHRPADYISVTPRDTDYALQDKYVIKSSFAHGSSCFVCAAIDRRGRHYAVKKIIGTNQRIIQSVNAEVMILKRLARYEHVPDSICRFIELISIPPSTVLGVTEFFIISRPVISKTFDDLRKNTEANTACRVTLLSQVLEGLAYLHNRGCMHRDIKPGNIVASVTPPQAVIIDFGAATWEPASIDHYKGTITYLAPEIVALKSRTAPDGASYGNKVDVWGLGLTLYELFTRTRTNAANGLLMDLENLRRVKSNFAMWCEKNPEFGWLYWLFEQMTEWDPDQRISAADALMYLMLNQAVEEQMAEDSNASNKKMRT